MASLKKNFLFTASYQLANVLIVLVTAPYISRVLGAQMLGTYTYTFTLAGYFLMFANLGFSLQGKRSVAAARGNRAEVSRSFVEVYTFQLIVATFVAALYLLYVSFLAENTYRLLLLVQAFYVTSSIADISWLFFGMENFKATTIRNFVIKLLTVVAIFLFVKTPDDVVVYTAIMAVGTLLSQLALWIGVPGIVDFKRKYWRLNFIHLKRSFILFIPVIAVSLYTQMDKLMLGSIASMEELAYYENAYKVITIPISLITAFETVMLPRMVNLTAKANTGKIKKMIEDSFSLVMMVGAPMTFGLAAVSELLTSVMFGSEFEKTGIIMMLLAVIILFASWAGVIRKEILIPRYRDKEYIISVFLGAITNLILNALLISRFGAIGAAFATIAAEASVCIYHIAVTRKTQPYGKYLKNNLSFFIASVIMGTIVYIVSHALPNTILSLIASILIGVAVYAILFVIIIKITGRSLKDNLLFEKNGDY